MVTRKARVSPVGRLGASAAAGAARGTSRRDLGRCATARNCQYLAGIDQVGVPDPVRLCDRVGRDAMRAGNLPQSLARLDGYRLTTRLATRLTSRLTTRSRRRRGGWGGWAGAARRAGRAPGPNDEDLPDADQVRIRQTIGLDDRPDRDSISRGDRSQRFTRLDHVGVIGRPGIGR